MTSGDPGERPNFDEIIASLRRIKLEDASPPDASELGAPESRQTARTGEAEIPALFRPHTDPHAGGHQLVATTGKLDSAVPRQMPPLKDRLVSRMGQSAGVPPDVQPPARGTVELPENKSIKGRLANVPKGQLGTASFLLGSEARDETAEGDPAPAEAIETPHGGAPPAPIRDEAEVATLLRPLLRQWLDDNMKRVLSRALHRELEDKDLPD